MQNRIVFIKPFKQLFGVFSISERIETRHKITSDLTHFHPVRQLINLGKNFFCRLDITHCILRISVKFLENVISQILFVTIG